MPGAGHLYGPANPPGPGEAFGRVRVVEPSETCSVAEAQAVKRFLLGGRAPSLSLLPMQLARSRLQYIDRRQRDCSQGPHAGARRKRVLGRECVVARALPDALQILVSHRRYPLREVVLVMS